MRNEALLCYYRAGAAAFAADVETARLNRKKREHTHGCMQMSNDDCILIARIVRAIETRRSQPFSSPHVSTDTHGMRCGFVRSDISDMPA